MSQSPTRAFQFTLSQLLLLTAVCGVLIAACASLRESIVFAVGLALIAGTIAFLTGDKLSSLEWLIAVVIATVMTGLFIPPREILHGPSRRGSCMNNLRNITLALQQYEQWYGSFPPAYIADANGKPIHSWRVLLLPFLEQRDLYDKYRFDEPWNGRNNSKLHHTRMRLFECLADKQVTGETSYVAIVGAETAWPGEVGTRSYEIKDAFSSTILLAEVHNSGIHWMEPRDLELSKMAMTINPKNGVGISSGHPKGAQVSLVDGRVKFLSNDLPPATLRALLTIADGEEVGEY